MRPDRIPVLDAFAIVPHAVGVDQLRACVLRNIQHQPVHMGRNARHQCAGQWAIFFHRPVPANQIEIAADPAGRDDDLIASNVEIRRHIAIGLRAARGIVGGQDVASHPCHPVVRYIQPGHPVPKPKGDLARLFGLQHPVHKGFQHPRPGPPCDVKARHGIAMPMRQPAAPFGPADHWEPAHPQIMQPAPHLSCCEIKIGLGPVPRPVILRPVELG